MIPQVLACSGLPVIQEESFQPSSDSEWEDEGDDVVGGKDHVTDDAASDQVLKKVFPSKVSKVL